MRKCLICHERNIEEYGICDSCKERNLRYASIHTNMKGYTAVVTGGRIKIGYATALRLLRDGARVLVITRYPFDALNRYQQEPDYDTFHDRLIIYGFNLMYVNRLDELISFIQNTFPEGLDILINNAAQTIQKAPSYYEELDMQEQNLKLLYEKEAGDRLLPIHNNTEHQDS